MADVASQIDRIRSDSPLTGGEFAVPLCALIYLRWADFQEAEQEAIAAFEDTNYSPVLPSQFHWRSYHDAAPERLQTLFGQELPSALERLGNERHNLLATHLHRIAPAVARLSRWPTSTLCQSAAWLADQPFETHSDRRRLLETLDAVLVRSGDRYFGYNFTPPSVAQRLIELAAPSPGERLYDPCFGSAGLLTAALDYAQQRAGKRVTRGGGPLLTVFGVEINRDMYTIGLARLALAGVTEPQLELGNSLERLPWNNPQREGFDVVVVNPPWGLKVALNGLDQYPVRTTDSTSLFIQHALAQLRPGGRAAIVVPATILSGSSRGKLRQMLIEQHTVEAVVGLAPDVLRPATNVETSLLLIRRDGITKSIRMVNMMEGAGAAGQPDSSWEIPVEQLADIEYDLTPKRRDRSGLDRILASLPTPVQVIPLGECVDIRSGPAIRPHDLRRDPPWKNAPSAPGLLRKESSSDFATDVEWIPYIRIRDVQSNDVSRGSAWLSLDVGQATEARSRLRAGDILLTKSGTTSKSGMVRNGAVGGVAAAGLFVLRTDGDIVDPHYLLAYLQSAECRVWLDDLARGGTTRYLSMRLLKSLPVPVPPLSVQRRAVDQHRKFGVDVVSYLAQLLSEQQDTPIAASINDWVMWLSVALKVEQAEQVLGAMTPLALLASLEKIAEGPCPVNHCGQCGQPYHLDYSSHYLEPPCDYSKGIADTCLACWLGVGPSNETMEKLATRSLLVPWAFAFRDAISPLKGLTGIPEAVGLLNVLDDTRLKLASALDAIVGHLPNEEKARRVTQTLRSLVESVSQSLVDDVRISVDVVQAIRREDGLTALELRLTNRSALPLRKVAFSTEPQLKRVSASIPYMAAGATYPISFAGRLPGEEGTASVSLIWTGTNLRGDVVAESGELVITLVPDQPAAASPETSLGPSPYITGNPVKASRGDVFFGREELLAQIRRQIGRSGNVVLLEGNRRAGKTSILWHLEGPESVPGWLGVYCSFQGIEGDNAQTARGVPTAEVFRGIATDVAKSIQKHLGSVLLPDGTTLAKGKLGIADAVRPAIRDDAPFTYFREYLELLLEPLAEKKLGLLLLLDEFDKLQEGIDRGVTSPQVPENIRFLLQSYPGLSAVLTGTKRMKRLRQEYFSVLYGLGTACDVSSLSREAASRLVTEPVKGQLAYASEAVERAVFLTAGQPYLLQCLCDGVFRTAKETGYRSITLNHVNEAAEALIRDNGHFADLFRYAGSDRRRLILALCHRESRGPDALRLGMIQEKLSALGVDVRDEQLASDLEWLTDFELLSFAGAAGGETYSLAVPLMGTWIDTRDYAALVTKARSETEEDDHD